MDTQTATAPKTLTGSQTSVCAPILKGLLAIEEHVKGLSSPWQTTNPDQAAFLSQIYPYREELKALAPDELKVWAKETAQELNAILAEHGYEIRLRPWPANEGSFGVVSILDCLAEWFIPGDVTEIMHKGDTYPAVDLRHRTHYWDSPRHDHQLLGIEAQHGYEVWMTLADEPLAGLDLIEKVQQIRTSMHAVSRQGDKVHATFPMVTLCHEVNIEWLVGLSAQGNDGAPVIITQALQETRFRMNEFGARAQSAVGMGTMRGMTQTHNIVIDQPFYLWLVKDDQRGGHTENFPIFAAYITPEDWSNPGDIKS